MVTRVRREHETAQFDSGHPDLRPGVVTGACRSDTAAAVVRLHLGPLIAAMAEWLGSRLLSETMWVRFLLAAIETTMFVL